MHLSYIDWKTGLIWFLNILIFISMMQPTIFEMSSCENFKFRAQNFYFFNNSIHHGYHWLISSPWVLHLRVKGWPNFFSILKGWGSNPDQWLWDKEPFRSHCNSYLPKTLSTLSKTRASIILLNVDLLFNYPTMLNYRI